MQAITSFREAYDIAMPYVVNAMSVKTDVSKKIVNNIILCLKFNFYYIDNAIFHKSKEVKTKPPVDLKSDSINFEVRLYWQVYSNY